MIKFKLTKKQKIFFKKKEKKLLKKISKLIKNSKKRG